MMASGAVQPTPDTKEAKQVLLFALIELERICDAQNISCFGAECYARRKTPGKTIQSVAERFVRRPCSYTADVLFVSGAAFASIPIGLRRDVCRLWFLPGAAVFFTGI
jgi:hypothetical protein